MNLKKKRFQKCFFFSFLHFVLFFKTRTNKRDEKKLLFSSFFFSFLFSFFRFFFFSFFFSSSFFFLACFFFSFFFFFLINCSLDSHHSFVVEYELNKDKDLDVHLDQSTLTVNVCLGKEFEGKREEKVMRKSNEKSNEKQKDKDDKIFYYILLDITLKRI